MKKHGKRLMTVLLVAGVVALGAGCTSPVTKEESKEATIGIVQYVDHVALDAAREGFVTALADNGYTDGDNITIDVQNAQGDQSNLSTISDRFISNKVDMVLAIATPAAQAIAGKTGADCQNSWSSLHFQRR